MLTMTTTTVGVFMYKCGLCPHCIGKRLIVWRQQAANRVAHMKKSHLALILLLIVAFFVYIWTMYPQIFYFVRYRAWTKRHQSIVRHSSRFRRNFTYEDVCSKECVPDAESMMASGVEIPHLALRSEETFSIVTLSSDDDDVLRQFLGHYSTMRRVQKIVLHWNNPVKRPPDYDKILDMQVPLDVRAVNGSSFAKRFKHLKDVKTEGVMVLDSNVLLSREELYQTFSIWKAHPWGIVGYYGGNHDHYGSEGYKHSRVPYNYYSMVQSGAFLLHREYLRLFVQKFAKGGARINCDDIALNFLVSNHCRCAAAYYIVPKSLYIRVDDKFEVMSSKWQYNMENNICLNYLTNFFGGMPLKSKTCFW